MKASGLTRMNRNLRIFFILNFPMRQHYPWTTLVSFHSRNSNLIHWLIPSVVLLSWCLKSQVLWAAREGVDLKVDRWETWWLDFSWDLLSLACCKKRNGPARHQLWSVLPSRNVIVRIQLFLYSRKQPKQPPKLLVWSRAFMILEARWERTRFRRFKLCLNVSRIQIPVPVPGVSMNAVVPGGITIIPCTRIDWLPTRLMVKIHFNF